MKNNAPVNVKLEKPTIELTKWEKQAFEWKELNNKVDGNPDFFPLTIKAAYVMGIIHDICDSVSILLSNRQKWAVTYMPAYGVFASSLDILGRCILGNEGSGESKDIVTGFRWLIPPIYSFPKGSDVLLETSSGPYTIGRLVGLRHYSLHGQATPKPPYMLDYEILGKIKPLLADGLERYWGELQNSDDLCNNLAKANIIPFRDSPVLTSWVLFEKDGDGRYHSVEDIFNRFNWS